MDNSQTIAQAVLRGDPAVLDRIASSLLVPHSNNFVERPWGGMRIRSYKGYHALPDQRVATGLGLGEAFEIAAFDDDEEARRFPSMIPCADGSTVSLPELLDAHGAKLLGERFIARYGACFPLLPKTLDVRELLSVQGHPPGNTEVYVIIDAERGATLRLGFNADMDAALLERELTDGLAGQKALVELLDPSADLLELQHAIAPWLAEREATPEAAREWLEGFLADRSSAADALSIMGRLKVLYWRVLDSMNAIEVEPGQVIHNATPRRLLDSNAPPSAEVHALGNPEGLEFLALEIRRPGPTFRAWDNVRFPQRRVDVADAIAALNLRATTPADFLCEPAPVPGRAGVSCSVDSAAFRIEHLRPGPGVSIDLPAREPYSLHVLEGEMTVSAQGVQGVQGAQGGRHSARRLGRGESALVPVGVAGCRIEAAAPAHAICVTLPEG